jgi:glycosyltransferase involved in cell wall biosynthesis
MTPASKRERPLIAFVSDAAEFAGAEQYMVWIIEALRDHFDFVVVASDQAPDETRERSAQAGAETTVVRGLTRRPTIRGTARLVRTLRRLRPDVIHINMSDQGGGLTGFLAARFAHGRNLATLHNAIPNRDGWKELLSKATLRNAENVIAVSDQLGLYLESRRIGAVVVKHGLLPPSVNPDAREVLEIGAAEFVVGGIGRLHRQKGWDILCRAAPLVHQSRPDVRFVVIGEGEERDALAQEPTCGHVEFRGYVAEASSLLGAFDLLVIPSRYEGLGLVAIETMLAGVPIVAARIPSLEEVLGDAGRLVPPEDPELLAETIVDLAGDPAQRAELVARGAERAPRLFDRDRMADQTAAVYESLIAGKRGSRREDVPR